MKITGKLVSADSIGAGKDTIVLAGIKLVPGEEGNEKTFIVPFTPQEFRQFSFGRIEEFEITTALTNGNQQIVTADEGDSDFKDVLAGNALTQPNQGQVSDGIGAISNPASATPPAIQPSAQHVMPTLPGSTDDLTESPSSKQIEELKKVYGIKDEGDTVVKTPKVDIELDTISADEVALDNAKNASKVNAEPVSSADTSEATPTEAPVEKPETDPVESFDSKAAAKESSNFDDFMNGSDTDTITADDMDEDATEDEDDE